MVVKELGAGIRPELVNLAPSQGITNRNSIVSPMKLADIRLKGVAILRTSPPGGSQSGQAVIGRIEEC
jgi:hypothetical protein